MKTMGAIRKIAGFSAILAAISLTVSCKGGSMGSSCKDWVAKIDEEVICQSQIDAEYNAVISTYAKMQGLDKDKFIELINNDKFAQSQPMLIQMRKTNFTQRFINEYLFYREALKNNVDKDPAVQAIINYQTKSVISQHFQESSLQKDIVISDEDAQKFYIKNKDKIPGLRQLPITEALDRVKRYLGEQKKQIELQKRVQEMRDKFKIEMNKNVSPNPETPDTKKSNDEKKPDKTEKPAGK